MSGHLKDLRNRTFGRLRVIRHSGFYPARGALWLCRCKCGNSVIVASNSLVRGATKSCGCLRREVTVKRSIKHGFKRRRKELSEYRAWLGMIARCGNRKHARWEDYGGRGIQVCARWRKTFMNFLADMGRKPSAAHTLDRRNNDGNYCPSNCRWATQLTQQRNRRKAYT